MSLILVADDDPGAREVLSRICEHQGHRVEEARDAARARQRYEISNPDLVIVDLAMPHGGGRDLIAWIREQEASDGEAVAHDLESSVLGGADAGPAPKAARKRCRILVVTGYAKALTDEEAASLDADMILPKPVELEDILAALDSLLKQD